MENLEDFQKHIIDCYPQEACGVVIKNRFMPIVNEHPEPANNFAFPIKISEELALKKQPYAVIHSHTMDNFTDDPRTPSEQDMKGQSASGMEWGVVHCDGQNVTPILYFGKPSSKPLLDRKYISNVYDCFTLVRDFYFKEFDLDLGTHPRPADWQSWNPHYIEQNFKSLDFRELAPHEEETYGDVLVFNIASRQANHLGVFLHDDTFMHHLHNRKSCKDSASKWLRQLTKVLRYENK